MKSILNLSAVFLMFSPCLASAEPHIVETPKDCSDASIQLIVTEATPSDYIQCDSVNLAIRETYRAIGHCLVEGDDFQVVKAMAAIKKIQDIESKLHPFRPSEGAGI